MKAFDIFQNIVLYVTIKNRLRKHLTHTSNVKGNRQINKWTKDNGRTKNETVMKNSQDENLKLLKPNLKNT